MNIKFATNLLLAILLLIGQMTGIGTSQIRITTKSGLELLADSLPNKFKREIILYTGNQFFSIGRDLFVVPISALWSEYRS